jgi:hypothetical protein
MRWIKDRWHELADLGSGPWLALGVWLAVLVGLAALIYVLRQRRQERDAALQQTRPYVAVYMESHAADWHLIELVVRNFGQTAAYDVEFDFVDPPTVAKYEDAHNGVVDIGELRLPYELPTLAPGQEWRTVWDSTLDRAQLGGAIEWKFEGAVTYYDRPAPTGRRRRRGGHQFETKFVLDWDALQPVQRVELLTNHDLAKREKQKLELLRSLLNYFHYASQESRSEVVRDEIDRINRATEHVRERMRRRQVEAPPEVPLHSVEPSADGPKTEAIQVGADEGRHREGPVGQRTSEDR